MAHVPEVFVENPSELLGRKVTIRYRLVESDHPYSEVVGVVQSIARPASGDELQIVTRKGVIVTVATADIVAGKVFAAS